MAKLRIFVSATIVLIFTHASAMGSPVTSAPDDPEEQSKESPPPPDENLSIVTPKPLQGPVPKVNARYYSYRQALTFRGGVAAEVRKAEWNDTVWGFQYLFPKFLSPKLEAGADVHQHGRGHIHAGLRWFPWERDFFRPSYKVSIDHFVDSEKNLATLTEWGNYYVRFSGTLEYVAWDPFSVRLEPELVVNFEDTDMVVTLGISRGW